MTPGDKVWYSTDQAASYLGLNVNYLRELASTGAIESSQHRPKGRRRFRQEWLDAYADNRRTRRLRSVS